MANREHVEVVKQGQEAIERWRQEHPRGRLDLRGAALAEAQLTGVCLRQANLSGARLSEADLHRADLAGADLSAADLFMADLSGADLSGADLRRANLSGVDLRGVNLTGADLTGADAFSADLRAANLTRANLTRVNLTGANLWWADLLEANLSYVSLSGAILYGSRCARTRFSGVDVSQVTGLRRVEHFGPSSVDLDTLIESYCGADEDRLPALEAFFVGVGVPRALVAELPRILAGARYRTCFIAFGEPDRAFAGKLKDSLEARGISCWPYAVGGDHGERTWPEIPNRRGDAERTVMLCSAQSLALDAVLKEIEEQTSEDPDKLAVVSLDNLWKAEGLQIVRGGRDLKPLLLERSCVDFSDASSYQKELEKLLNAVRRTDGQS